MKPDFFIFAGEISADTLGSLLIKELKEKDPSLKISAVAGPKMRKNDIKTLMRMEDFEIMGFLDVIFSYFKILKNFLSLRKKILSLNPTALIFIDYPTFNLGLEKSLRKKGYSGKIIHLVAPTIWAWKKGRVKLMEKNLDLLLTIFPFEKKIFKDSSLRVEYVGHPLLHEIKKSKEAPLKIDKEKFLISIFPGSRKREIKKNLPLQLKACRKIEKNILIAVSISSNKVQPLIKKIIQKENQKVILISDVQKYPLMKRTNLAIATSGTITLELALFKVPTIVTYYVTPLEIFIATKIFKISLPFYCIVNIIAEKEIFEELYGKIKEKDILSSLNKLLENNSALKKCKIECKIMESKFKKEKEENITALILPYVRTI